jgi:hypothetical protein
MTFAKSFFLIIFVIISTLISLESHVMGGNPEMSVGTRIAHAQAVQEMDRQQRLYKELNCLTRNIYYEARGESEQGQLAVAQVTLNRVESGMFPNSICQFSWRCDSTANFSLIVPDSNPIYQLAWNAVRDYHSLDVVTHDTYWFHANYVKPRWRKFKERVAQIDTHIFYRQK